MVKTKLAYFAGFFDGEGSLSINSLPPNIRNHRKSPLHHLWVQVGNDKIEPLNEMKKYFGGSIHPSQNKGYPTIHWKWCIIGKKAAIFLKMIYPYIIIKKSRIEHCLEFQKQCVRKTYPHRQETPKELIKKREEYKNILEDMNNERYFIN